MRRIFPDALLVCAVLLAAAAAHAAPRGSTVEPEPDTPESIEARRLQMEKDMTAWLPQLVGRFTYEGVVQHFQTAAPGAQVIREDTQNDKVYADGTCNEDVCDALPPNVRSAKGKADCVAIGAGAGVQCVVHVVWDEEWAPAGQATEGGVSFLGPAAILYGFDPNTATIRYLMLNTNGVAESEAGQLSGNTVRWIYETRCESDASQRCRQVTRVRAAPDARTTQTSIDLERWDLNLFRWVRLTNFELDMRRVPPDHADDAS